MTRSRSSRHPARSNAATSRAARRALRSAVVVPLAIAVLASCDDDDIDTTESDVRAEITEVSSDIQDEITEASEALESGSQALDEAADAVEEGADEAAEALARNLAAQFGTEQFDDAGHPIDGGLDCTATVSDGVDTIDIECTGTTEDGGAAELTGTTEEIPGLSFTELNGTFTGTVDGTEVFTADQLG
jgi:hypothetical protein